MCCLAACPGLLSACLKHAVVRCIWPDSVSHIAPRCCCCKNNRLQLLQSGALTAPAVSQLAKCDVQAASSTCLEQVQTGQQPAPATSSEEAGEGGRALVPVDSNVYQQIAAASAAPASAPAPAPARSAGSRVTVSMLLSVFAAAVGVDVLLM